MELAIEADHDEEPAEKSRRRRPSLRPSSRPPTRTKLSANARQCLTLQRDKQAAAVVKFVCSASRFKLLAIVPKKRVLLRAGRIRTPATCAVNPDGKPADPLAEEILQCAQQHSASILPEPDAAASW